MCLTDQQLLEVWERGQGRTTVDQSLLLLECAQPQLAPEQTVVSRITWQQLIELSLGQRDARLLQIRQALFGSILTGVRACPNCDAETLIECSCEQLLQCHASTNAGRTELPGALDYEQWHIDFRLPTSRDMQAIVQCRNAQEASEILLQRCVTNAINMGQVVDVHELPPVVIERIESEMSRLDPLADVQLDCQCPQCGHRWQTALDVVSFLWAEISAWARRVLRQVHQLASAYGWSEASILSMSAARRQLYLDMIDHE